MNNAQCQIKTVQIPQDRTDQTVLIEFFPLSLNLEYFTGCEMHGLQEDVKKLPKHFGVSLSFIRLSVPLPTPQAALSPSKLCNFVLQFYLSAELSSPPLSFSSVDLRSSEPASSFLLVVGFVFASVLSAYLAVPLNTHLITLPACFVFGCGVFPLLNFLSGAYTKNLHLGLCHLLYKENFPRLFIHLLP
jgi:hypothetical protein